MDKYSSGEDVLIKIRKPYTITKQRERWTGDEHNRFLEALKLHGRAWQRIEEHIGTKNAVQIRSHAQKFFSKLEKDALVKGVPMSKALDIDIPPPRPKRKPSNPYPRKTGTCTSTLQAASTEDKLLASVSSSCPADSIPDLEKGPIPQKPAQVEEKVCSKENQDDDYGSDVFTNFQEAPSTSVSSANKHSRPISAPLRKSCSFREFVPPSKDVSYQDEPNVSHINIEPKGNQKSDKLNADSLAIDGMQAAQSYPTHLPAHILEGSLGTCTETSFPEISCQESAFHHPIQGLPSLFDSHEANARKSSIHQFFPPFNHPSRNNQEDFQSFIQFSSAFSSLIMSNLLQNPASHAAASFAASFQSRQCGQAPSMAAMAAATVAAATAWWAANGLLPMCPPLHGTFPCAPVFATAAPSMDVDQSPPLNDQSLRAEHNETLKAKTPASELPSAPSSDSEESGGVKLDIELKPDDQDKPVVVTETESLNKTKHRKQVDRSSCGSNTTSSGDDGETDALEKHEKATEEPNEPDTCHPTSDSLNRRFKTPYYFNESWKEVSEEGRLAFKALFSRQVLPQSFSPPLDMKNKDHNQKTDKNISNVLLLDLNTNAWGSCLTQGIEKHEISTPENKEDGLLTIRLEPEKLKARRTGFKPYKRCSVEAKESRVANATSFQGEERGPKRIRIEEEALS